MINFENLSAFISFVTTPNDTPTTKFYDENFKNDKSPIFKKYKEELNKHFKDSDKYKPNDDHQLYSPNGYFLFGKFDLLIFTLTDDTEFANRNFCPFPSSILDLEYKPRNFDFQVFSTLIPKIKTPKIEQNYFFKKNKKNYHFIIFLIILLSKV